MKRPLLRYHGGKWKLAPWIISHLPQHRIYVEPFGGAASVLLQKPRSYAEVYNDLDGEVVNLFRVVRNHGAELLRLLEITPFAREEFVGSYIKAEDTVEQARRTLIRSFMGFGSGAASGKNTGFRSNSNRSGTTPAHDWKNYPEALRAIIERLQGVVIENRDAITVMKSHDGAETVHYVDPPYVMSTRDDGSDYRFEMTDEDHADLADVLHSLTGSVVLSGYESNLYNDLYRDWQKIGRKAFADGAQERTEYLWINPAAHKLLELERVQERLFA